MADYQKVDLYVPPTPEEQAAGPQGSEARAPATSPPPSHPASQPGPGDQRPSWLPEKFKSPEDLAKAYGELEKKISAPPAEKGEKGLKITKPEAPEAPKGLDLQNFTQEFMETGQLSEESFGKLEKMGLSKALVDTYIEGVRALSARQASAAFDIAGGQDQYQEVQAWAAENLSAQELEAYNAAVTSGRESDMLFAVKGLVAQYRAAAGTDPKLVSGRALGGTALQPFRSMAEWKAALRDPRYDTDPAYRADVMKRLEGASF